MRLTDQAAASLFLEKTGVAMQVSALSILATNPDLDAILKHVGSRLSSLPHYRKRLAFVPFNLAHPVWVDHEEFDIAEHITKVELPGDTSVDDLISHAVDIGTKPLDRTKPLWAMHLVSAKDRDQTILVHVVHLAALDNVTLGEDAHVFFDLLREPRVAPPEDWTPEAAPSEMDLASEAVKDNTAAFAEQSRRLGSFSEHGSEMIRRATESVTRFLTEPICIAPWNQGLVGQAREFRRISVPYLNVRKLRRKLGGTDNDIVLTVLVEAAARYLANKSVNAAGRHLRVFCPVKVRREDTSGIRGSRMSGVFPVADAEPRAVLDRLTEIRWENESIKQNREAQALQLLSELAPPLPTIPGVDDATASRFFGQTPLNWLTFNPINFFQQFMPGNLATSISSSLPPAFSQMMAGFNFSAVTANGAQTSLFFAGHEVKEQLFVPALAGNLGFAVAISTYAQTLTFNLVADRVLMPDIDMMQSSVEAVTQELMQAAELSDN
ncbi:MAG: DUF1298 domain-containing protein [Pseudomonadales bacterium]|nr:DUF1298 domain-containing protein [Pseudomonadales bacterium]